MFEKAISMILGVLILNLSNHAVDSKSNLLYYNLTTSIGLVNVEVDGESIVFRLPNTIAIHIGLVEISNLLNDQIRERLNIISNHWDEVFKL